MKRPIQKLIPFEIMNCAKEDNKNVHYAIANRPMESSSNRTIDAQNEFSLKRKFSKISECHWVGPM